MGKSKTKEVTVLKIVLKFVTPLIVILSLVPGPHGKPFIDWSGLLPSKETQQKFSNFMGTEFSDITMKDVKTGFSEKRSTVYKWKDDQGRWQFSEVKPQHIKAETMQISNKINTMAAVEIQEQETTPANTSNIPTTGIPSLKNMQNMMKDVENIKANAENRNKTLESM